MKLISPSTRYSESVLGKNSLLGTQQNFLLGSALVVIYNSMVWVSTRILTPSTPS